MRSIFGRRAKAPGATESELTPPGLRLCTLINPSHYRDRTWISLHHDLERYSIDKHCFQVNDGSVYRKGWEWTHCIYSMDALGLFHQPMHALGVGVGHECVIFYLAARGHKVIATDLYDRTEWSESGGREASGDLLEKSRRHCAGLVDLSRVRFENQDGTKLSYADNTFDIAWSLSSIEHFGGHDAATQAVSEMARVVKPDGIIIVATEVLLLPEYTHPEYFSRSEITEYLVSRVPTVRLLEPIAWDTLPNEYLIDSIVLPHGVDRRRRHVVLNDGAIQWTSVMLVLRVIK